MGPAGHLPPAAAGRIAVAELAFALVSILLAEVILGGVLNLGLLPAHKGENPVWPLYGPLRTALALGVYVILARSTDEPVLPPVRSREPRSRPAEIAAWVAGGMVAATLGSMVLAQLSEWVGLPVEEQAAIFELVRRIRDTSDVTAALALVTSALLLAPLVEELLFRGFLFGRLRRTGSEILAHAVSASAFAFIHGNLSGFIVYAWLGLVFAWVYRRTGHLWTAVAVHASNNALALSLLFLGDDLPIP